jgi:3-oxoacyl-[acyl-carrier-protein] synthase-1
LLKNGKADAVILANRSASLKNDNDYIATISGSGYYPSPALFVYTLPNIVTGEIAIRHQIQGETAFYILEKPEDLEPIIQSTMSNNIKHSNPQTILCGWCACDKPNSYYAKIQIIWNN